MDANRLNRWKSILKESETLVVELSEWFLNEMKHKNRFFRQYGISKGHFYVRARGHMLNSNDVMCLMEWAERYV